ncbi:MAG: 2-octaprenyl-6-methoxyphenyl hydroxylase [Lamprocystis purpurea]|uniref:2-octaprenyl-6-methoxyphenyl hydroxylase n=1 Tax=Lamprocystis purpurea TaxID=61598 RepID=UPI000686F7F7|nr:2-octaprenyl-6-methoxyphenyl hydroxylase [Lamprocystis purpurea]MBV5275621.1 2-octaprenyl-6-methoxyphenyl hydroxylase [Lamprocystis purpurea]
MHPEPSTRHSSPAPCQAQFDLVIVGGGLIGGSLACALADTGLRVAVIEAVAADAAVQPSYDERVIALSLGSRRILGAMGLWDGIAPEAEPILRVHIAERGGCGTTRLDHAELGVEALGYVASARAMGAAIRAVLAAAPQVEWLCPARVTSQRLHADRVDLEVQCGGETRRLSTRLLVAADGGDSLIRRDQGIAVEERAYEQQAVITTVTPDRPRTGWAFERFTDTGPLALLPMTGGRYSVVWTCRDTETAALLGLSDADFLARLQGRFGFRLGRLGQAAPRRAYPLKLLLTRETIRPRLVLIGNAAHTLHPVAGQGFNLGLRDVAALAEVLAPIGEPTGEPGFDPGAATVLEAYRAWRGRDQQRTATLTDTLARLFVNPWLPLRLGRNLGLLGLDLLPPARRAVARHFMGTGGRAPRLARGLPLSRNPAESKSSRE